MARDRKRSPRGGRGGGGGDGSGGGGGGRKKKDGKGVALRCMQIFVKPMSGPRILLDVMPFDTIDNVKAKIEDKDGLPDFPPPLQHLRFEGIQLADGRTLKYYDIHHGDTVQLRWSEATYQAREYLENQD